MNPLNKLFEMFSPEFVLRNPLYASMLLGGFVPLIGAFLVIGRKSILALALPQVSTLGVAAIVWIATYYGLDLGSQKSGPLFLMLALLGAFSAMAAALGWQFLVEKRAHTPEDAETGAIYALAAAGTLAIAATNLVPELGLLDVLKGEILAIPDSLLIAEAAGFALIGIFLFLFARPLHFILYDRLLAFASGLPTGVLSGLILALVSSTIALGGLCAGPLTVFAFLVLPSLSFLPFVRHIKSLYFLSSIAGLACAFTGFWLSYCIEQFTLPVPAAQVLLLAMVWFGTRFLIAIGAVGKSKEKKEANELPSIIDDAPAIPAALHTDESYRGSIRFKDVSYEYANGRVALEHASFETGNEEFIALIGPNGGGKTTVLKLIMGLLSTQKGEIEIVGQIPSRLGRDRRLIGYVPQDTAVRTHFPATVMDAALMGSYSSLGLLSKPGKNEERAALDALGEVGLAGLEDVLARTLSGGQQQRLAIARALVANPRILLLDEPTSALDERGQANLFELLKRIKKHHRLTVLMVSHDVPAMLKAADQLVCLNRKIVWSGPSSIYNEEVRRKLYGYCAL